MFYDHRAGALTLEELEEDYGEDVEFLLARLKKIEEDKDVRTLIRTCTYVCKYVHVCMYVQTCPSEGVCAWIIKFKWMCTYFVQVSCPLQSVLLSLQCYKGSFVFGTSYTCTVLSVCSACLQFSKFEAHKKVLLFSFAHYLNE